MGIEKEKEREKAQRERARDGSIFFQIQVTKRCQTSSAPGVWICFFKCKQDVSQVSGLRTCIFYFPKNEGERDKDRETKGKREREGQRERDKDREGNERLNG